jgi:hypothetical protein
MQFEQQAGPFLVKLSSDPAQPRIGHVDLNVALQDSATRRAISDAQVLLHLRRPGLGGDILEFTLPARFKDGQYATAVQLPSQGKWPVRIDVRRGRDEVTVSGVLNVGPAEPRIVAHWPFFVSILLIALLFAINIRLRRGRRRQSPP